MNLVSNYFRRKVIAENTQLARSVDEEWVKSEKAQKIKKWITYYRRNWEQYVEDVLQIRLYDIQKYKIHMMGIADVYWDVSTRGIGKSFLCALGAVVAFMLYPHSEIVITSSTIGQASIMVEKKIRDELIKKLSPYLLYLYEHEHILISKGGSNDGTAYTVTNKLNGSTISVVVNSESARGNRATMIIYEEARLLKKGIIDSVFEPMGHNRPTPYSLKKEYQTPRWQETAKSIYITSTRYEWEWFIRGYRKAVALQFANARETYVTVAEDFYSAIWEGSRTWADYRKMKNQMSDADFLMEGLNQTQGMIDDAFFSLKMFVDNQEIQDAFVPPTNTQVLAGTQPKFRPKGEDEVRIVAVDFAFANKTAKTGVDNDNTIIECISGIWQNDHFVRQVEYITQWEASDSTGAAWRVKELRQDFDADYVVNDGRSGGEVLVNILTEYKEHPYRGRLWDAHGLTVCDRMDYQVISQAKYDDIVHRTVDPNAMKEIPLDKTLTDEEYRKELKKLQHQLRDLHNRLYRKKVPVIIAYEGWDAAGKGGNIKRITEALDPRGYEVCPIASPEPHEKARHYLWRFWTRLPKDGHIAIFDRTWYGRVMVERLEGFCSENDWKRAYNEMNEFEKELHDWGAVIIKFWVQIDKDTQLERFNDRQNTPEKQWKITDEDWRNREKWDQYEVAVNEMIQKTSTTFAPWHILESVDKKYARIKALRIVVEELERVLK